jgi:oligopeptide transport system ATP-binding protein
MSEALLTVRDLAVHFPVSRGLWGGTAMLKAVDGVSFAVAAGESLGVVGESGCGKSTLARAVLRLIPVTAGSVIWLGEDLAGMSARQMRAARRGLQIVFQDPLASLDPRMTIGATIGEPLDVFEPHLGRAERARRVRAMMERVGLAPDMINRYPHEISGGQGQRVGIARAMILSPKLVICDEAVSALDVSIQAQIIALLRDLQAEFGLSLLFISHDLAVVRQLCQRVMVLYLGKIMEIGAADAIFAAPRHPYSRALLAATPVPDPLIERARRPAALAGDPPSPLSPPSACVFRTRCAHVGPRCASDVPDLSEAGEGRQVACHYWRELS